MKKSFKLYFVCWAILFVVFQIVCFVTPNEAAGFRKFDGAFFAGYTFLVLAFIGQLVCAYFAFRADSQKKMFYRLPLITVSYTGLIAMLIFGTLTMAIPNLPTWIGVIVCLFILAMSAVMVIGAGAAANLVEREDEKTAAQTAFIKNLTIDAQGLAVRAKSDVVRTACKRVYEAARYSDPMSNEALCEMEGQITAKMQELFQAVDGDDTERTVGLADEATALIRNRNLKCKALK